MGKLIGLRRVVIFFGFSGHLPSSFNFWRCIENAHVLVRYRTLSWISWPNLWISLMSSGKAVESRINLTCLSGVEPSILRTRLCSGEQSAVFEHHKLCSVCLVCIIAGQNISRCTRSPFIF
jgi:hypothetical protein